MTAIAIRHGQQFYPVEWFMFSGGEIQVSIPTLPTALDGPISVVARLQSPDSFVQLLLLCDILDREYPRSERELIVPYFPYARQDRVMASREAFSLKAIARVINSLGFAKVRTCDPHSDVTPALIDRLSYFSQVDLIRRHDELALFIAEKRPTIISPDAGAVKKAGAVAAHFGLPLAIATKVRDTSTGAITGTALHAPVEGDVLIVDDICDGGRTFIELAKALRQAGASRVHLYVTHGIFSKGLAVFSGLIDSIFTTDSFQSTTIETPLPVPIYISHINL
jgi:ribose-phosphate pyrophosphokinase